MFEPGKITLLTGPRAVGKTLLAVDAAWHAANRRTWLGHLLPHFPVIITDEILTTSTKLRAAIVAAPGRAAISDVLVMKFAGWEMRSLGLMRGERSLVIVDVGRETAMISASRGHTETAISRLRQLADDGAHVIMVGVRGETATRGHSLMEAAAANVIRVYSGMVTLTKPADVLSSAVGPTWRFDTFAGQNGDFIKWHPVEAVMIDPLSSLA